MQILFITNVPSPYRVDFFNELGKYCDLTVLFEKATSKERDKSWLDYRFENFKGIFLKGISFRVDMSICWNVIRHIKEKSYDVIVCSDFMSPTGMIAIEYMRLHNIPYYLESDGGFPKNGKGLKEIIKKHFISNAKGYFSTGNIHDDYYLTYGADLERIVRYPFSSIKDKQILSCPISKMEKDSVKKTLGIFEDKIVLAVGQFIHRKGFDLLLEGARYLSKDVGIYFVGGNPTEQYLSLKDKYNLENVYFVGFQKPEDLKKYYQIADVFVLPTREDIWGLVINEAMAYGVPVVTTNKCLAGVELIQADRNGYLIETENIDSLVEAISKIISDKELQNYMAIQNLNKAHLYTVETMADRHLEVFKIGRKASIQEWEK